MALSFEYPRVSNLQMKIKMAAICFIFIARESIAGLTLKESFQSAIETNYNELKNQSLIDQAREIKGQNKGNLYPKISLRGTYLKQDNITPDQRGIGLNLTHTLYRGGRDRLALDSADKNITIVETQRISDQLSLYSNVIEAYYNYFLNLNDQKNLELLKRQSRERVEETRKRVQVGRSRQGELLQAEAQLSSAEAQLFNGNGLLIESEDRFYLLTGLDKKIKKFSEPISIPIDNQELETYLDAAYKKEDIKIREMKIELAELDIKSSKSFYYPTLDLATNYYFNKNRSSTLYNSSWDVGVTLNFPLFEGGLTNARVRESLAKKEEAIYGLSDYKKNILLEITSRYETFHRYLDQIKAFDLALEKAKKSYDETLRDYRLGLVSNLDVLSSLNLYLDSKRNSEKTKIQAMMNQKLLEASAGVLP